jgi:Mg-chelatase subunit ChlD
MPLTFERAWVFFLLPVVVVALLLLAWPGRRRRGQPLAVLVRLVMLVLLIIAAAGPIGLPDRAATARQVVLVDTSASLGTAGYAALQRQLGGLSAPQTLVAQFAEQPHLVSAPEGAWPSVDDAASGTDLEAALRFAGQLLGTTVEGGQAPGSRPDSVVLISDGLATDGDALGAAEHLAANGVRVDVLPLGALTTTLDVGIEAVTMPPAVWARDPFSVTVSLYATTDTAAEVAIGQDGFTVDELPLDLKAGDNHIAFSLEATSPGLSTISVQVNLAGDERPQNNRLDAIALVRPAPAVLIVAHRPDAGQHLQAALRRHNITADVIEAGAFSRNVDGLLPYQLVLLEDISADLLTVEQLAALKAYVYAHGRGLIVFGGPSSYTLGSYAGSPLEEMLPVTLEPPQRTERPRASLLLIVDQSTSMTGLKIQLVKEAAMRAVEILQPNDQVGVLGFNHEQHWSVPFSVLGAEISVRQALDGISAMNPSGGTDMLNPLSQGIAAMEARPQGQQHIILLSDGVSAEGKPEDFQRLVEGARANNITISSIAIGVDADTQLMARIADWGQGRFRLAVRPADLPRMIVAESQYATGENVQRGLIQPQIVLPHPLVSGFSAADFPRLSGHVAVLPRPVSEADTVLVSPLGDPLLAAWQYGLGRVVAWTGDAAREWSPGWAEWDGLDRFWVQMVRYSLPDPTYGPLLVQTRVDRDQVRLTMLATGADSRGINLGQSELRFLAPDNTSARVVLPQSAPGEYASTFGVPLPGAYNGLVTLEKEGQTWEVPVGFVVGYSPEYSPRVADGAPALRQIAEVTHGQVLTPETLDGALVRSRDAQLTGRPYAPWFLLAAVLFWPLEIAIRRRWRPWR